MVVQDLDEAKDSRASSPPGDEASSWQLPDHRRPETPLPRTSSLGQQGEAHP